MMLSDKRNTCTHLPGSRNTWRTHGKEVREGWRKQGVSAGGREISRQRRTMLIIKKKSPVWMVFQRTAGVKLAECGEPTDPLPSVGAAANGSRKLG